MYFNIEEYNNDNGKECKNHKSGIIDENGIYYDDNDKINFDDFVSFEDIIKHYNEKHKVKKDKSPEKQLNFVFKSPTTLYMPDKTDLEFIEYMDKEIKSSEIYNTYAELKNKLREEISQTKSRDLLNQFIRVVDIESHHETATENERKLIMELLEKYNIKY